MVPFGDDGFKTEKGVGAGFGTVMKSVNEQLDKRKRNRFTSVLQSQNKWQEPSFEIPLVYQGEESCQSCRKFPQTKNTLCSHCYLDREIGRLLPEAKYLTFHEGNNMGDVQVLGYSVSIDTRSKTAANEGALTLFLAYGRAISDQERTPFSVANTVSEMAKQLGANCRISELDAPEEFEGSFKFYQRLMGEVSRCEPDRVIVDITGGTKVMAAAMVHAALTQQWGTEVIFEYVGGPRDANGRVRAMELKRDNGIITRERMLAVLGSIRQYEFARAVLLADSLPLKGKAGFVRKAADLFWRWDNFHYEETEQFMEEMASQAKVLDDDKQLHKIADTILRMQKVSGRMKLAIGILRQMKDEGTTSLNQDALEGWIAILGDTIANARRRAQTDPVDCVLRCYRAIEIATQIAVFKLGINPWKPDWKKLGEEKLATYISKIKSQEPPRQISLDLGIKLIETLTLPLPEEVNKDIRTIMSARNFSYLEHGYDRVSEHTALSLMKKMEKVTTVLLSMTDIKSDPLAIANQLSIEA